jgi:hypothetical protein
MCAAFEDDIPEEWLSDGKMKDYNAEHHELVTSIETSLSLNSIEFIYLREIHQLA